MAKLFITLYLMVIASVIVFSIYISSIYLVGESIGAGALIDEKVSKGAFILLDKSLDGLNQQQRDQLLQQYKNTFGAEFSLTEKSKLNLNDKQRRALEQGRVVSKDETSILYLEKESNNEDLSDVEEEELIAYYQRHDSSLVWRLSLDYMLDITIGENGLNTNIRGGKFIVGKMALIQTQLLSKQKSEWSTTLDDLQKIFELPLALRDIKEINKELSDNRKAPSLLQKNKVINISQGTNYVTFIQKIPNSSKVLQIGPVEIPWYLRNLAILIIIALIMSLATTLFLWIWPLWSNLTKIKKAADDFGSGNYDARIQHRKRSHIAKISKAFNTMAEQTQRSIRAQKELTSAVSHELRTPVARMRFALEMLDSSDGKTEKARYIKDINEDIDELNLLLEELLTYARFDQKDHHFNPALEKLIPWISSSMDKLMPLAKDKTLNYKIEGIGINESALFEARLMTRVLDNLVQNALRYAKQTIEVTLSKDLNDFLLIVEDDGIGVAAKQREQVFDAFSRIDASRDRASGGFGLGLAIVSRIIKAHDGKISIHRSALGGARFEVRIPVKQAKN